MGMDVGAMPGPCMGMELGAMPRPCMGIDVGATPRPCMGMGVRMWDVGWMPGPCIGVGCMTSLGTSGSWVLLMGHPAGTTFGPSPGKRKAVPH